ncbi:MAG: OsmC family protein [Alistipes sp.]|nr:OsmC family protein [Alistipes sp.]
MIQKVTLRLNDDRNFELVGALTLDELNPKELLLYATAKCAGLTIVSLLKEHISEVKLMEITLEGSLSTPTVVAESRYTHLNIIYRAECQTLKEQMVVSRAVNLAHDKYCGMVQMIRHIAPLSREISIVATDAPTA